MEEAKTIPHYIGLNECCVCYVSGFNFNQIDEKWKKITATSIRSTKCYLYHWYLWSRSFLFGSILLSFLLYFSLSLHVAETLFKTTETSITLIIFSFRIFSCCFCFRSSCSSVYSSQIGIIPTLLVHLLLLAVLLIAKC